MRPFYYLAILAVVIGQAAWAGAEDFLPISLKCPEVDVVVTTARLVLKNGLGQTRRTTVYWDVKDASASRVKVEEAGAGGKFVEKTSFNRRAPLSRRDEAAADKILFTMQTYRDDFCVGGKTNKGFDKMAARNRRTRKKAAAELKPEGNGADDGRRKELCFRFSFR